MNPPPPWIPSLAQATEGPQKVSCGPPLSSTCACLHTAFIAFSESTLARRAPGKIFPRFGVAPRVGVKDSHTSVWPLEWSCTRGGFFDFEVGGHDGAHNGRVHVIVPFVWRKNGSLFDCQRSYKVLVLRVPGLEEGVIDGWNIYLDAGRAGHAPGRCTLSVLNKFRFFKLFAFPSSLTQEPAMPFALI